MTANLETLIARGYTNTQLIRAGYTYPQIATAKAAHAPLSPLPRPCPPPLHLWRRTRYQAVRCYRCYAVTTYIAWKGAA